MFGILIGQNQETLQLKEKTNKPKQPPLETTYRGSLFWLFDFVLAATGNLFLGTNYTTVCQGMIIRPSNSQIKEFLLKGNIDEGLGEITFNSKSLELWYFTNGLNVISNHINVIF